MEEESTIYRRMMKRKQQCYEHIYPLSNSLTIFKDKLSQTPYFNCKKYCTGIIEVFIRIQLISLFLRIQTENTAVGIRCADHATHSIRKKKLARTSPTSGGRSLGIVRLRTKATEFVVLFCFVLFYFYVYIINGGVRPSEY
jgi:hypothetical protein